VADRRPSLNELLREAEIQPHGVRLDRPDLAPDSHSLAVTVRGPGGKATFHVMFNAYWEPLTFELPRVGPDGGDAWRRWIDTARDTPDDIADTLRAPAIDGSSYTVQARSLAVLFVPAPLGALS
jgi:isoamylase